ncbi:MAG: hypothetical protein K9H84_06825 [Bacteroidales bacterium]|nr:hypothetical protein [Bacteroidales bacterium]
MWRMINFEIKRNMSRPAIYIYWLMFFALGFFIMQLAGGAFKGVRFSISGDAVHVNSPGIFDILFGTFSYLGIVIAAAITVPVAFRDFRANAAEMFFSLPVKRNAYVFSGFLSALLLNIFAYTGLIAGLFIGTKMPYLNQELFGPFMAEAYYIPFLVKILPNLFFLTAIFYGLTLLKRNVMINWISIAVVYLLYALGQKLLSDLDTHTLAALLDPFGIASTIVVSAGHSAGEMNNQAASMAGVYLYNRLLWVGVGVIVLIATWYFFRLSSEVRVFMKRKHNKFRMPEKKLLNSLISKGSIFQLPEMSRSSGFKQRLWSFFTHLQINMKWLYGNLYFWMLLLLTIIFMGISSRLAGKIYDTETYPVTWQMLLILNGTIKLFVYLFIALFSGELLFRERASGMHEIFNAQARVRLQNLWAKFLTVISGVVVMLLFLMFCGMIAQSLKGYHNFELTLYLKDLFALRLPDYILFAFMAFFLHVLVNNKYAGFVAILAFYLLKQYVLSPLIGHNLLIFGGRPNVVYSDMNGFGYDFIVSWWFFIYWFLFAGLLFMITALIFDDGSEHDFKSRFKRALAKRNKRFNTNFAIQLLLFGIFAAWMIWQTSIRNDFYWPNKGHELVVDYEQKYCKYKDLPQPKIVEVNYKADLWPDKKSLDIEGYYWLKNKTDKPMTEIHLNYSDLITRLELSKTFSIKHKDEKHGYYIYSLKNNLLPEDSVRLNFHLKSVPEGFTNSGYASVVQPNGTFFYNSLFPSVGYNENRELSNQADRKKEGLKERLPENSLNAPGVRNQNFISRDADFIRYEAVISTSAEQTAITPGKLISRCIKNDRNVFHYKSEKPMINYFAVLSARLSRKSCLWQATDSTINPLELTVLYHPDHDYNVDMMLQTMKQALTYYDSVYSTYQFSQLTVVEFPRFATYAQSFPNMIPYSEGIGFIADLKDIRDTNVTIAERKINYPAWFIAHEIAHQWWAHQLIAADAEGAQFLMESITQYSAYKLMQQKYDDELIRKLFREETFKYVSSLSQMTLEERPLIKVAGIQSSIYYRKGAMELFALDKQWGEESMQKTLQEFLKQYAYKSAPYPLSIDYIDILKSQSPDSLNQLIDDKFSNICFYDFEVTEAEYRRTPKLEYFVNLKVTVEKVYADGKGKEMPVQPNEYIPLGFYSDDGELVDFRYVKLNAMGERKVQLKLNRRPASVVIDPFYQRMSKNYKRENVDVAII